MAIALPSPIQRPVAAGELYRRNHLFSQPNSMRNEFIDGLSFEFFETGNNSIKTIVGSERKNTGIWIRLFRGILAR